MAFKINRNAGMMTLSLWLILFGLGAMGAALPVVVMGVLALAAGVLILVGR